MNKTLSFEMTEMEAANLHTLIEEYLAEIRHLNETRDEDQAEIERLESATRAALTALNQQLNPA